MIKEWKRKKKKRKEDSRASPSSRVIYSVFSGGPEFESAHALSYKYTPLHELMSQTYIFPRDTNWSGWWIFIFSFQIHLWCTSTRIHVHTKFKLITVDLSLLFRIYVCKSTVWRVTRYFDNRGSTLDPPSNGAYHYLFTAKPIICGHTTNINLN